MKISVIVPLYNKQRYIRDCLTSLIRQTHEDIEIVVWDDGSTDGSVDAAREVKDNRITIYTDNENGGVSYARNRAMERATGDLFALQDADDISHPRRLETQFAIMKHYRGPRCRVNKLQKAPWMDDWLDGPIPSLYSDPLRLRRISGCFSSEMFVPRPIVPFREDVRLFEERMWISDMNYIWASDLLTARAVLYAKRADEDQGSLTAQLHDGKHDDHVLYGRDMHRMRRYRDRPESVESLVPIARETKALIESGGFFK